MLPAQRQSISILQRWQHTIRGSRVVSSSYTICVGADIVTSAIRPLSLYSTSTLQNYDDAPSLQHVITRSNLIQSRIYPQHYQCHISNNINHNFNANNQLRWVTSGGRHTHHGGRGRGNDQGRGRQSTNRFPMMKEFNTLSDAIEPYYNNLDKLTPRNLSAFWSALPRLLIYQNRGEHLVPQLRAIFHKTADQIHSYGPQDLVTTTLGFAKTIQTLQRNKRVYVSGSYEGYLHSILIGQRDAVFDFIARTVVPILHQFNARDLKDLAYTYALLEYVPTLEDGSTLFDHIAKKSIPLLDKFEPQHISNTVWAFEKVKVSHPKLYERVGDHIITLNHLNNFTPQALSNILIAYVKAEIYHPDLFNKVADHIVSLDNLNGYNEQEITSLVWAYNKAGIIRQDLNNKFNYAAVDRKEEFSSQNLNNLDRWTSEEGIQNIEVAAQNDDDRDENNIKEGIVDQVETEEDDTTSSVPEDFSLLTVVQLKDRLRNLGLRVSGRKQDLIDRLNDHFQK